ncbi:hypothetical protein B0H16DRAFT_953612 [Mycena metata]|uniref:HIT-type domain-containing protein n=1 Tax=Mycena metata TaxID=1033252 RepID=A0AAD7K571_9AGAR|nr:hypothetical protein B0H16DRAFT_953612 [Mycena metata]
MKRFGRLDHPHTTIGMHSHSQSESQSSQAVAASARKRPQHRRRRTLSVSIPPAGTLSKITIAAQSTNAGAVRGAAAGAFTLTGSARAALRGLGSRTSDDSDSDSYEEYTSSPILAHVRTYSNFSDKDVPSISRTASPFEGERAPIPPGWGGRGRAQRARERSRSRERTQHREQAHRSRIHPALETLERESRVGTGRVVCAACAKPGANFPRCARCSKMFCSRGCRTAVVHRCASMRRTQTA